MFYVFLSLTFLGFCIVLKDKESSIYYFMFFICFAFVSILVGIFGNYRIAEFTSRRIKVVSLGQEIETIRNAWYKDAGSGVLVGGSLDNFQQSTLLSDYIKNYAEEKASYNKDLVYAKSIYPLFVCKTFGIGAFVSKKIEEITLIE